MKRDVRNTELRLASYICAGLDIAKEFREHSCQERIHEYRSCYLRKEGDRYQVSALGMAMIGKAGDPRLAYENFSRVLTRDHFTDTISVIARILSMPSELLRRVDQLHFKSSGSIREIAQSLANSSF